MRRFFKRLHARLGELWWWSAWQFLATRVGDVINVFVGVWLVPHFVDSAELGAVLPLLQVSSMFGWPLGILVTVFTKYLNEYRTKGEKGKVKSLIRTFVGVTVLAVAGGSAAAALLMPHFFERIRVTSGSLGVLVLAAGVLGTVQPVFVNGLMALKKFKAVTWLNFMAAPIRCAVMAATMPIRALSGYMVGQVAPFVVQIGVATLCFRREVRGSVKAEPFWRDDGRRMLREVGLLAVAGAGGMAFSFAQVMIIRQRLPEVESAGYYMISRFAEMAGYLGATAAALLFPLAAEAHVKGREMLKPFLQVSGFTAFFGLACMAVLALFGRFALGILPGGAAYVGYVPEMVFLTANVMVSTLVTTYYSYETANGRYGYVAYACPLQLAGAAFLVAFTGYGFFNGILPACVVDWMASLHVASLRHVLVVVFSVNALMCLTAIIQLLRRRIPSRA